MVKKNMKKHFKTSNHFAKTNACGRRYDIYNCAKRMIKKMNKKKTTDTCDRMCARGAIQLSA